MDREDKLGIALDAAQMGAVVVALAQPGIGAAGTILFTLIGRTVSTVWKLTDSAQKQWDKSVKAALQKTYQEQSADSLRRIASAIEPYFTVIDKALPGNEGLSEAYLRAARGLRFEDIPVSQREFHSLFATFRGHLEEELLSNQKAFDVHVLQRIREIESGMASMQSDVETLKTKTAEIEALKSELAAVKRDFQMLHDMLNKAAPRFIISRNSEISQTEHFQQRDALQERLHTALDNPTRRLLVSGMGGLGKTQLCLRLFNELVTRHYQGVELPIRHIGFFTYNASSSMDEMVWLGLGMNLTASPSADMDTEYQRAWDKLQEYCDEGLLLFVDNIPVDIQPEEFVQLKKLHCSLILTSRRRSLPGFDTVPLDRLSLDQCVALFRRINDAIQDDEVPLLETVLEKRAGRHTLTVDRLAHISQDKDWTVRELGKALEKVGFEIHYIDDASLMDTVLLDEHAKLYNMADMSPGERNILQGFALLPDQPIPVELCKSWLIPDAQRAEEAVTEDWINRLYKKGWLERGERSYGLHTVYAQMLLGLYKPVVEEHVGLVKACRAAISFSQTEVFTKALPFFSYAVSVCERLDGAENVAFASLLHRTASLYDDLAEYEKALALYVRDLAISEKVLGLEHPETATTYNNIALVYQAQGDYGKALEFYEKALAIKEKVLGLEHPETAATYNNIAGVYQDQGDCARALEVYEKALAIKEKVLGLEHPETATTYNNIALVYQAQGDYGRALEFYEKALAISEKVLGLEHPDTATTYNNIALVYKAQGEYSGALEVYEKALAIYEKVLGLEHPDTATSYNNIAGVYQDQGEYSRALEVYEKALAIYEKVLGLEHPDTATSYNNIAGVYQDQGDNDRALEVYEKALAIKEKVLGLEHPDTAATYNNIAGVYQDQGDNDRALEFYEKALHVFITKLGWGHPYARISLINALGCFASNDNPSAFSDWLNTLLESLPPPPEGIWESIFNDDTPPNEDA